MGNIEKIQKQYRRNTINLFKIQKKILLKFIILKHLNNKVGMQV